MVSTCSSSQPSGMNRDVKAQGNGNINHVYLLHKLETQATLY